MKNSTSSLTYSSLEKDLIRDEGWKVRPYRDSRGLLTVGVGHNLDAQGLCEEAIVAQLRHDIRAVEDKLDVVMPWWKNKPEQVQRVLVNLGFNLGVDGLQNKWPLTVAHIKAGNYDLAAKAIRSNKVYTSQVGQRAERLAILLDSVL